MSIASQDKQALRWWPCLIIVALQTLVRFGVPVFMPGFEGFRIAFLGSLLGTLLFLIWWLFFSKAPRRRRWNVLLAMVVALAGTVVLSHSSMNFIWLLGYAIPFLILAVIGWLWVRKDRVRKAQGRSFAAVLFIFCAPWLLFRTEGMTGDHVSNFVWRWSPTAEEKLLASDGVSSNKEPQAESEFGEGFQWPGFRGARRNGMVNGIHLATDWEVSPPRELWRRPIGPGWSSFAVRGGFVYTQEQRGEEEMVSCYDLETGQPIWKHGDQARFYESIAGAGPRATPSLCGDRIVALGATGLLNMLDGRTGALIWQRDIVADTGKKPHIWGFASSPWVMEDKILVAASGRLVAYDRWTGALLWQAEDGGNSYSSPHVSEIDGVAQVILISSVGTRGFAPDSGATLWQSEWGGIPMVQPAILPGGGIITNAGEGFGLRRLQVGKSHGKWQQDLVWSTKRFRPNFNDFVIHDNHIFGFDGHILACISLEDGSRQWKRGRYGQGQLLLIADQNLLLVLSERGELALVSANAEAYEELARISVLEGKTWNHPVLVGQTLLIRNGQEMAAYHLVAEEK